MFAARFICSWIGAFGLAAGAFCQNYVGIYPAPGGPYDTYPYCINEAGVIAGSYSTQDGIGPFRGFVRDAAGTITTFAAPSSTSTDARSINAAGAITGSYVGGSLSSYGTHGFVRDPAGNFTSFDADPGISGPQATNARSINAGGAVTGYYSSLFPSPTS